MYKNYVVHNLWFVYCVTFGDIVKWTVLSDDVHMNINFYE